MTQTKTTLNPGPYQIRFNPDDNNAWQICHLGNATWQSVADCQTQGRGIFQFYFSTTDTLSTPRVFLTAGFAGSQPPYSGFSANSGSQSANNGKGIFPDSKSPLANGTGGTNVTGDISLAAYSLVNNDPKIKICAPDGKYTNNTSTVYFKYTSAASSWTYSYDNRTYSSYSSSVYVNVNAPSQTTAFTVYVSVDGDEAWQAALYTSTSEVVGTNPDNMSGSGFAECSITATSRSCALSGTPGQVTNSDDIFNINLFEPSDNTAVLSSS